MQVVQSILDNLQRFITLIYIEPKNKQYKKVENGLLEEQTIVNGKGEEKIW
jgi:hypothetical protein